MAETTKTEIDLSLKSPYQQFQKWLQIAKDSNKFYRYNKMIISTVDESGMPDQRNVAMLDQTEEGFVFFATLASNKCKQLEKNPRIAIFFDWMEIMFNVRIQGFAQKLGKEVTQKYWDSLPNQELKIHFSANNEKQSAKVNDYQSIVKDFEVYKQKFEGKNIELPDKFMCWLIKPIKFEFYVQKPAYNNERYVYERKDVNTANWETYFIYP